VPPVPADIVTKYCVVNAAVMTVSLVGVKLCEIAPLSLQFAQRYCDPAGPLWGLTGIERLIDVPGEMLKVWSVV
jgi:hypothetical protein